MGLELMRSAADFLAAAGSWLAERPVVATTVATVAERTAAENAAGLASPPEDWYAVVRDGDAVVGAGMRTAPFGARPLFLLPMPDPAAVELARRLHARGEVVGAVNGALPASRLCAEETARLTGGGAEVHLHLRLFELTRPVAPAPVPGRLRAATTGDLPLVVDWFTAFHAAADEQAGREPDPDDRTDPALVRRRVESGLVWLWEVDGEVVHLTARNAVSFGAARIGPVYTPPAHRGRGYASVAVAAVSAGILAEGGRPCLFTDQANPTSNRIYAALGYRPVLDMAEWVVHPAG